jgi:hypothetical protein
MDPCFILPNWASSDFASQAAAEMTCVGLSARPKIQFTVQRFLNHILGIRLDHQNRIFDLFVLAVRVVAVLFSALQLQTFDSLFDRWSTKYRLQKLVNNILT